jgi:hypothetical protein
LILVLVSFLFGFVDVGVVVGVADILMEYEAVLGMLLNFGLMLVNFEIGFTRAISAAIIGAKKFDGFGE